MKTRLILLAALLVQPLAAEEANPFVKNQPKEKPLPATGESFMVVEEQILVPADLLDGWLEKNPLTDDAAGLRAEVQTWVQEGAAQLDHTAVSTGTVGRDFGNQSHREQIYATDYMPPQPGEWPFPTAFETRNVGFDLKGNANVESGSVVFHSKMGFCGMLPHRAWSELAEKTRLPDDVFIPLFKHIEIEATPGNDVSSDPSADPFAPPPKPSTFIRFKPGVTYLAGRAANDLPESMVSGLPATNAGSLVKDPHRMERLFFFRGTVTQATDVDSTKSRGNLHVSAKLIRVNHKTFSDWLRTSEPTQVPLLAWTAVVGWLKGGEAKTISDLTSPNQSGSANKIENVLEAIYPTEYEPGKRPSSTDGKPSPPEPSQPTAFETRHVGVTLRSELMPDPNGPLLRIEFERVVDGGKSVHNRILREGEWKEDITFPVFVTNRWLSELRLVRGKWMLLGSGSDIDEKRKLDPAHAVLAFVKVE